MSKEFRHTDWDGWILGSSAQRRVIGRHVWPASLLILTRYFHSARIDRCLLVSCHIGESTWHACVIQLDDGQTLS